MAAALAALALLSAALAAPARSQGAPTTTKSLPSAVEGFTEARATWFEHPWTGSCGYGRLDPYPIGIDAVFAMPDTSPDYETACGRCYEVSCRGIQAKAADGSVDLPRFDACADEAATIVVQAVDTCPCEGNEAWCCGDMPHFDLSKDAFSKLAPAGKGIIGLRARPVPCALATRGAATLADWAALDAAVAMGAAADVFVGGQLGVGWRKAVHGDAARAMYTYEPSVQKLDDGASAALCTEVAQYGGASFDSHAAAISTFAESSAVEFWAQTSSGIPDVAFRVASVMGGICGVDARGGLKMADGATGESVAGWTRFLFSLEKFDCTGEVTPDKLNRIQWENKGPGAAAFCVRDVRLLPK